MEDDKYVFCKICSSICIFISHMVSRYECKVCQNYQYRTYTQNEWIKIPNNDTVHFRFINKDKQLLLVDGLNNLLKKEPCQELTPELAKKLLQKLKGYQSFQ